MSDYISRDELLDNIRNDVAPFNVAMVFRHIHNIPAADVALVRHGRWDENGRCTLCGRHAPFWAMASTYYKSPWCHECGARMDKEDKHEAD